MNQESHAFTEEQRIRAAYARRRRTDDRYAWSNPSYVFGMRGVERQLLALLSRNGLGSLNGRRILEIGCGTGHWLREFVKWGARAEDVVGMDLLADRISEARARCAQMGCRSPCGQSRPVAHGVILLGMIRGVRENGSDAVVAQLRRPCRHAA